MNRRNLSGLKGPIIELTSVILLLLAAIKLIRHEILVRQSKFGGIGNESATA